MKNRIPRLGRLSWKLTLIYALLFSAVLLLLSAGVLYGVKYYLQQQTRELLLNSEKNIANRILDNEVESGRLSDPELLSDAKTESAINVIIADADKTIVNATDNYKTPMNGIFTNPGVIRQISDGKTRFMVLNTEVYQHGILIAYLQVTVNMKNNDSFMQLLLVLLAIADFLGILLSVLVGYIVSRRMLDPIDRITQTATSISIQDLDKRIPVEKADDELTRLSVAFNDMIGRLQISIDKQNQFVSDASHELRTPISVIQGYINLMDRWGKDNRTVLQESIDVIKNETTNMRDLMEKLLFLARTDKGQMRIRKERFDLAELLLETAEETLLISPEISITVEAGSGCTLIADRNMIKQVLRNLVENAVKYTNGMGKVDLKASYSGNKAIITVNDNGIGIPEEDVKKIFNRFYRADKARSKDTGGNGLGLAIVKSIVDIHGGKIDVKSAVGKGTDITILLPKE